VVGHTQQDSVDEQEPLFVSVPEAGRMLRLGRAKAYQMAANGEMPGVVRIGRAVRVSLRKLRAWADLESAGPQL
jgi:excisionase family DNA binding protein